MLVNALVVERSPYLVVATIRRRFAADCPILTVLELSRSDFRPTL